MKIGERVYAYSYATKKVTAGVIISRAWRWNPLPEREYIVRQVGDLGTDGIAGLLTAAFNGKPESLSVHTRGTLYKTYEAPQLVQDEAEGDES